MNHRFNSPGRINKLDYTLIPPRQCCQLLLLAQIGYCDCPDIECTQGMEMLI
jgi:hypothetical protein